MFGGFGPIVTGIVYLSLSLAGVSLALDGQDIFTAILSTYLIAFIQAGSSVFNQIESWSVARSLLFHLGSLYLVYVGAYIVNSWIPFEPLVLLIFTAVFIAVYLSIWFTVYFITRAASRRMNERLKELSVENR